MMKYEKPDISIIELHNEVITFGSADVGENGGFDYNSVNDDPDVY